jgi:hypothetical protein
MRDSIVAAKGNRLLKAFFRSFELAPAEIKASKAIKR